MAFHLRETAKKFPSILAVVGSSHLDGIEKLLKQGPEVQYLSIWCSFILFYSTINKLQKIFVFILIFLQMIGGDGYG
jgi:pheromone shutdown protein TraB